MKHRIPLAVIAAMLSLLWGCVTTPEKDPNVVTECSTGQNRCNGNVLQRCDVRGKWISAECEAPKKCVDLGNNEVLCRAETPT